MPRPISVLWGDRGGASGRGYVKHYPQFPEESEELPHLFTGTILVPGIKFQRNILVLFQSRDFADKSGTM